MQYILTDNVWQTIKSLIKKSDRKTAAIAYVSSSDYLTFGKGDLLICDASDQAIKSGETSAAVLEHFYEGGAEIYSCQNLHAKVLVFGQSVLIGSCNLSESSAKALSELAVVTSDTSTRSQALAYIHHIKRFSEVVNAPFLKRISQLPVSKRKNIKGKKPKPFPLGKSTWVIKTYPINQERYKSEEPFVKRAEKEVRQKLMNNDEKISWVRFTGKSGFRSRAREGDTVIEMHSDTREGKRIRVLAPAAILKKQDHGRWTRFYYEAQEKTMPWTQFAKLLKNIGITHIKKNSVRKLKPMEVDLITAIFKK